MPAFRPLRARRRSAALHLMLAVACALPWAPALGQTSDPTSPGIELAEGQTLYFIDPSHSSVGFQVPFMGITRVSGRFNQFFGNVVIDEEDVERSRAYVVIRAASIDTNLPSRDRDVRGETFLDVDTYPEMVYVGRRVERRGEDLVLVGELTLHGTTLPVEVPFAIVGAFADEDIDEMGGFGTATLDRTAFGMAQGRFSGERLFVGDEVTIELSLRLRRPGDRKEAMLAAHPPIEPARALQEYVGEYLGADDLWTGLSILAGELVYERGRGGHLYRMVPIAPDRFLLHDLEAFVSIDPATGTLTYEREGRDSLTFTRR